MEVRVRGLWMMDGWEDALWFDVIECFRDVSDRFFIRLFVSAIFFPIFSVFTSWFLEWVEFIFEQ